VFEALVPVVFEVPVPVVEVVAGLDEVPGVVPVVEVVEAAGVVAVVEPAGAVVEAVVEVAAAEELEEDD